MEKCVEIARCAKTLHQIGTKNYINQVCEEITHNVLKKLHIKSLQLHKKCALTQQQKHLQTRSVG